MSSMLLNLLDQNNSIRLTETLLHFLWEGMVIGVCALVLAWLCRTASARVRYGIHAVSLACMALCVPITFGLISPPEQSPPEQVAELNEPARSVVATVPEQTTLASAGMASEIPNESDSLSAVGSRLRSNSTPAGAAATVVESKFAIFLRAVSPYAAGAYLVGLLVMFGRLCFALWGGHRLRRSASPIRDRQLLSQIREQAHRIGLKVVPVVAYCERITIPVVAGILRPMILLPTSLLAGLDPEQLHVILVHEMAHIRRFDLLANVLQRVMETLLFFHPAVWYVSRQLSIEREHCCDDVVVQAGYGSLQYASTLVRMAELCAATRKRVPATQLATLAASGGNGSELKRRILRLLNGNQQLRLTRADSLTLLLVAGTFIGTVAGLWHHAVAASPGAVETNQVIAADDQTQPAKQSELPSSNVLAENQNPPDKPVSTDSPAGKADATKQQVVNKPGTEKEKESEAKSTHIEFSGTVVDTKGKPVAATDIWFTMLPTQEGQDAPAGTMRKVAVSDEQGKFTFQLEPIKVTGIDPTNWMFTARLVAKAAGFGIRSAPLSHFEKNPKAASTKDDLQTGISRLLGQSTGNTIKLSPEAGPVQGRLVDLEGRPVAGVSINVEQVYGPDFDKLTEAFTQSSRDIADRAMQGGTGAWITGIEWQAVMPLVKTNENGEFTLRGLGGDQLAAVTLRGDRVAADWLFILGREMEPKRLPHLSFYPNGAQDVFVGTKFTHAVGPSIPVSGVVTEFKSGKPIANAIVRVERLFRERNADSPMQLRLHTGHIRAVTNDRGEYRLTGVPPGGEHVINVTCPKSEPWLMASQDFSVDPKLAEVKLDVRVFRGIWLEGQVTDAKTGAKISGFVDYLALQTNPNIPQKFGLEDAWEMRRFPIDEAGHYKVPGLPGPGVLLARSFGKTVYPLSVGAEKIEGYDANINYVPTTPTGMPLSNWNLVQLINPPVDAQSQTLDLTLSAGDSVKGRVVGQNGSAVTNVEGLGLVAKNGFYTPLKESSFEVHDYQPEVPRDLYFKSSDNSLVGYLRLKGPPPADLTVTLQKAVKVKGKLIETETDTEAAGYHLYCQSTKWGEFRLVDTETDANGRFEIKGLIAGNVYQISAANVRRFDNLKNGFTIDLSEAKPGDVIELNEVTGKKAKATRPTAKTPDK